ncbi:MAG: ADP-glyceromanno-heptose 6-epimerase [Fibrobacter sp.]|jgi:ADP-L-glycero-D-manno-heptose 6-epimerase|nr:ADP-glyceromanno-heptose 6-epimerase [Fibrobacter sp.]
MIVITGGAGFIGSALAWKLNSRGIEDILIVDRLGTGEKWRNLVSLKYLDFQEKSEFIEKLESGYYKDSISTILHMGACSSTTETDADYLMENNFHYSVRLAQWWKNHQNTRFIYASSAATYGDGRFGYTDDYSVLDKLRPLNMYGYSKHLFDCYAFREGWLEKITGLKFFNVFGPNEYHKGEMRSLINKAYSRVRDEGVMSLFKSYNPQYQHGQQKRDFIYIKDVVEMVLFFMDNPDIGGLFNIGTGEARSWNDLANAIFRAVNKPAAIEYIEMPLILRDKYQYFTQADQSRLKSVGCNHICMSLEDAIEDYVCNYLATNSYLEN